MPVDADRSSISWKAVSAVLWMTAGFAAYSGVGAEDVKADADFLEYLGRMESADTNWTDVAQTADDHATGKAVKDADSKPRAPEKQQTSDQR